MKAPNFNYVKPASLDDALRILAGHGQDVVPIAGGQSLLATLNMRLSAPDLLLDIGDLEELRGISEVADEIRIGAATRHAEALDSPVVATHLPLLREALGHVAHVGIRNRGTIGGSLALADPAAEMPACVVACGGTLVLAGTGGRREVPAEAFFNGLFETDRGADELIVEVRLPVQAAGWVSAFAEFVRRRGDFAIVGLAALAQITEGRFNQLRLAYLSCTDRPVIATGVAGIVASHSLPLTDEAALRDAISAELDPTASPGWSVGTKLQLATVLTRRVLATLADKAE